MMQNMLDQQRRDFRELLTQERANARGGVLLVNEPIVVERVNHGLVPSHATTVQEGKYESESYQRPKELESWKDNEPTCNYKYNDFMT